ncbi:hypothetical protein OS125_02800 [Corynebacterium sp. P7003]|uniref:Uncharacterized protein n=1 Tax=Corynebacterium pygosceleis TaxID=2800406 RepID=A0ABT3WPL1_9CORY|nr:hypothetical protein [Corynebacterium pygosceleis]MCX7444177.1 hypothetical protein [Corynebacterium pygosceleis]
MPQPLRHGGNGNAGSGDSIARKHRKVWNVQLGGTMPPSTPFTCTDAY